MMTLEFAHEIASAGIERKIRESDKLSKYEFSPIKFCYEDECSWTFAAGSEQLYDEGCIPGAIFASVDKKDGHIWSRDEQERFYEKSARSQALQTA